MTLGEALDNPPRSWFSRFFSPRIEESFRLRVLALASLWLGCLGLAWAGGDLWLSLATGCIGSMGYWLGWRWRNQRSLARPLLIASAVIAVSFYMRSQMLEAFSGNWLPVGQVLVLVQAFGSFECRTRGGLYAGLILSGTVLFFASQQAFQATFGIFVVGFVVVLLAFLTTTFLEDGIRGAIVHWVHHRPSRPALLPYWIGVTCAVFILSGFAFWLMPKGQIGLVSSPALTVLPYSGQSLTSDYVPPEFSSEELGSFSYAGDVEVLAGDGLIQGLSDQDLGRGERELLAQQRTNPQTAGSTSGTSNEGYNGSGAFAFGNKESALPLDSGPGTVFFVRTRVTSYWLGRTLENFDGRYWNARNQPKPLVQSSNQDGVWFVQDNLNREFRALYQQTFYVRQNSPGAIYTGYRALSVSSVAGPLDGTGVQQGSSYRALSAYPVHSAERLRQDSTWVGSRRLISTPTGSQRALSLLSGQITGGATSDFEKVERIVDYLRQKGNFIPSWPETLTTSAKLDEFLFDRQPGDAMDYATATVMLARASGLPARLAVGYLPGVRDHLSGAYKVRQTDAHAWAEVYFADHGWVPFDSSPLGNLASVAVRGSRAGYFFDAGVGDAVVGAVKSALEHLAGAALGLIRNPVFSIAVPLLLLAGLVLRWVYFRPSKGRSGRGQPPVYAARLQGDTRQELLSLYHRLEKLLERKSGIHRKPWQTVADFTDLAGATEPRVRAQLPWFTQAVWHAAYDPRDLPTGMVEEARRRLASVKVALRYCRAVVPVS